MSAVSSLTLRTVAGFNGWGGCKAAVVSRQGVAEIRSLILPFCLKIQTKTKRTEYKFCSHNSAVLRGDDQEGLGRIADFSPV